MIFKKDRIQQTARTAQENDMENEQVYSETQEELDNGQYEEAGYYEPNGEGEVEEQQVEVISAPVRMKPQLPTQPALASVASSSAHTTTATTASTTPSAPITTPRPARRGRGESDDNSICLVARIDKALHAKLKIYSLYTQQSIVDLVEAWIRQDIPETRVEFNK